MKKVKVTFKKGVKKLCFPVTTGFFKLGETIGSEARRKIDEMKSFYDVPKGGVWGFEFSYQESPFLGEVSCVVTYTKTIRRLPTIIQAI